MREATIDRNTTETQISGHLVLEGTGQYEVFTGIRFLDHMLELFTKHGGFDLHSGRKATSTSTSTTRLKISASSSARW